MKPKDAAIAGNHTIRGTQRVAGKKHLCRFYAPAALVVRMDVSIPADWILQPLFLRKTQRGFNLRTDVRLADAPIEIRHEHHGRNLFDQGAISGFQVRELRIPGPTLVWPFWRIQDASCACRSLVAEDSGQTAENFLSLGGIQFRFAHPGMMIM